MSAFAQLCDGLVSGAAAVQAESRRAAMRAVSLICLDPKP